MAQKEWAAQTRRRSDSNILHYPSDSSHISHLKKTWYFPNKEIYISCLKRRKYFQSKIPSTAKVSQTSAYDEESKVPEWPKNKHFPQHDDNIYQLQRIKWRNKFLGTKNLFFFYIKCTILYYIPSTATVPLTAATCSFEGKSDIVQN